MEKNIMNKFLSYYPLKQGLKQKNNTPARQGGGIFLSYYPLKQGLKPVSILVIIPPVQSFLSYYPLKQGLKQIKRLHHSLGINIFILLSIKTRIET